MATREFTIDELIGTLRQVAGESTEISLAGDVLDAPFDELGYDSLALLETAARIEQTHGIALPDSMVTEAETPRALLDMVNERIAALVADPAR